jgi:Bacterial Ig domain
MSNLILAYISFSLGMIIPTIFFGYKYKNSLPNLNFTNVFKNSFVYLLIATISMAGFGSTPKAYGAGNPPVALQAGLFQVPEGIPTLVGNLNSYISDPDGDPVRLTQMVNSQVVGGTILLGQSNTFYYPTNIPGATKVVIAANGDITITGGYANGAQSNNSPYVISDSTSLTAQASFFFMVTPNIPPVIVDAAYTANGGQTITLPLLSNASDPDGDSIRVSMIGNTPITAGVPVTFGGPSSVILSCGTFNVSAAGVITFTGAPGYNGMCGSNSYFVTDSRGSTTSQTLNITVSSPANRPPVVPDVPYTVQGGQTITLPLVANASDPDGDSMGVSWLISPQFIITPGVPLNIIGAPCGDFNVSATRVITFTAATGYNGNCGSSSYAITDSNGATTYGTLDITVSSPINNPPTVNDSSYNILEGETIPLPLLSNASDIDGDSLTITNIAGNAITPGVPTTFSSGGCFYTVSATGAITVALTSLTNGNNGVNCEQAFSYTVIDGNGGVTVGTSRIRPIIPTPTGNPPIAGDKCDPLGVNGTSFISNIREGEPTYVGNFYTNSSDPDGDSILVSEIVGATVEGGVAQFEQTNTFWYPSNIPGATKIVIAANGDTTITGGYLSGQGGYSISNNSGYKLKDTNGNIAFGSFCFYVTPNNPPIAVNDNQNPYDPDARDPLYNIYSGTPKILTNILLNDSDQDGDTFKISTIGFYGNTISVIPSQINTVTNTNNGDIITVNETGVVTYYTQRSDPDGSPIIESFLYSIIDSRGRESLSPGFVNVVIFPADTTPPPAPIVTSPLTGTVTTNPLPVFAGTGEPGSTIVVKDENGNLICTTTVDAQSNWTCPALFAQSEGGHTYKVTQGDPSGNVSPDSLPVFLTFDIDTDTALLPIENAAPNNGDGNGDGVLDSSQGNVASKLDTANNSLYATLDAGNVGCTSISDYDFTPEAPLPTQDINYDYPIGLFKFTIKCATPGQSVNVTFILDKLYNTTNWVYRKYNQNTQLYNNLPGVTYGTRVIAGNTVTTISFSAQDGGPLDEDGLANGQYTDPSGPSITNAPSAAINNGGIITITNSSSTSTQSTTSSVSSQSTISSTSSQSSTTSSVNSVASPTKTEIQANTEEKQVQVTSNTIRTGGLSSSNNLIGFVLILMGILMLSTLQKESEEKKQSQKI